MSEDPTIPLLRKLLAFLQTKEVIDFFGRMEERVVSECMDANPSSSTTAAAQENVDYCSLPFHERHQVAAAVLNMSRAENSGSPFTRAKAQAHACAHRVSSRIAGPQLEEKLIPRMYRRFLKSRSNDPGQKETDPAVNTADPAAEGGPEVGFTPVVTHDHVPEPMLEEDDDGSGLDINLNLAITMHAQSAVAASTTADTSHGFSFPTGTSGELELNEGWFNYREDFLQLACIPVCAKNLGPGGGFGIPLAAGRSTIRNSGNGPEIFMERRVADRSNVQANARSPVTCRGHGEMSLSNLASSTSPANSRNLTRKQRAKRYFHVKPSSSREPTFRNLMIPCSELTGDSQMNELEREFWQHRGRQGNKEVRRHKRLQPDLDLMYGSQYYPIASADRARAAVNGCAQGIESNCEKFLDDTCILQDAAVAVRPSVAMDAVKENSSPHGRDFEMHVSQAERQRRSLFGDAAFTVVDRNVYESHPSSFPAEDARVRRQEKEHESGPGDGEELIDVNRVPHDGAERRPPEMTKWVEMLGQLQASERRCQSLLVDNHHLRQHNLSLKEQMFQLAENYKSVISENSSLLEKLRECHNHELARIFNACNKLG